ncbi:hypothetical protein CVT24_006939 [Panaeolus cyanescens]|uniref:Uncharacterized protein n=1 Tax=Panaeolus cyanescens TaxID=181874 RepID=A0A409W007_9AGAR|nr:hypothetical protein CVT24_006939 [Panaeolus cyanescens]
MQQATFSNQLAPESKHNDQGEHIMNPEALETSTQSLIFAWRLYEQHGHSRRHVSFIAIQASTYLQLIDQSVMITGESLSRVRAAFLDSSTTILERLREFKARANEMAKKFKEIHVEVEKLYQQDSDFNPDPQASFDNDKVPDQTLSLIEALSTSISMYHFWWQYMQLYAQSMINQISSEPTRIDLETGSTIHSRDVAQNSSKLKSTLTDYGEKIEVLRNALLEVQLIQQDHKHNAPTVTQVNETPFNHTMPPVGRHVQDTTEREGPSGQVFCNATNSCEPDADREACNQVPGRGRSGDRDA